MDSHVWRKPRRSPSVRRAKIASATGYTELKICFEVHRALQRFVEMILTLLESWALQVAELRKRLENIFTTKVPATEGKETEDFSAWVQPFTRERCRQNHQPLNRL